MEEAFWLLRKVTLHYMRVYPGSTLNPNTLQTREAAQSNVQTLAELKRQGTSEFANLASSVYVDPDVYAADATALVIHE